MQLKDLIKPTLDSVWIHFADIAAGKNIQLTHRAAVDLSDAVVYALTEYKGVAGGRRVIVGLKFDEDSEKILGHFIALLACLRSVFCSTTQS